jgi:hypothetical protein
MAFPIVAVIGAVAGIIEKIIPDPQAAAAAKIKMFELAQQGELADLHANLQLALAQTEVNKEEARDPSIFKSGWRPAAGWLCVAGFGYMTILRPLLPWVATLAGFPVPPLPAIDTVEIGAMLFGMLGLGGMRSFERSRGKA